MGSNPRFRAVVFLALLMAFALRSTPPVTAQTPDTAQRELRIERSLACPQCTDLPLDVCDQDICADMRAVVHQKVLAGESDAAIRQYFVGRYGSRVLLAPPKSAPNLIVWLLPFMALGVGAVAVLLVLRSARARPSYRPPAESNVPGVTDYTLRVEHDLAEIE